MPYENGSFDLIFSNDSFLHSSNKPKCLARLAQILAPGGAFVFTDILESLTAKKEDLKDVYARLSLDSLGDEVTYDKVLTSNGLKKVVADCSATPIIRHYGAMYYNATVVKKDQLLKEGVTEQFLEKQVFGLTKWIENGKK